MFDLSSVPWYEVYSAGKMYGFIFFSLATLILTVAAMIRSVRFLYFYYLRNGELFLFNPPNEDDGNRILREEKWVTDIGIAQVWIMAIFALAISAIAAAVWPVAIVLLVFLGIPVGGVLLFGHKERRKRVFLSALRGEQ